MDGGVPLDSLGPGGIPGSQEEMQQRQAQQKQMEEVTASFSDLLGGITREAQRQGLKSQSHVAMSQARMLSSAAAGGTSIRIPGKKKTMRPESAPISSRNSNTKASTTNGTTTRMKARRVGSKTSKIFTNSNGKQLTTKIQSLLNGVPSSPPGSPPLGFGKNLHPSYGYATDIAAAQAFASTAGEVAKQNDLSKPILKTNTRITPYSEIEWRQMQKNREQQQNQQYMSTYREEPKPSKPYAGAWMPSGKKSTSVSTNVIANKNKVYRSAKIAWAREPLNHYNKLHMKQL